MRRSPACLQKSRTSPTCAIGPPSAISQVCAYCVFLIPREQKRPITCTIVRLANEHVLTHVLVRQDLLQHLQGVLGSVVFQTFFSALVCPSRLNCCKTTFDCLVYPDLRVSICCFSARNCTSIIVSGSIQGSHRPVVNR